MEPTQTNNQFIQTNVLKIRPFFNTDREIVITIIGNPTILNYKTPLKKKVSEEILIRLRNTIEIGNGSALTLIDLLNSFDTFYIMCPIKHSIRMSLNPTQLNEYKRTTDIRQLTHITIEIY